MPTIPTFLDPDQHLVGYQPKKLAYICIKQHCPAIPTAKTVLILLWCFNKTILSKHFLTYYQMAEEKAKPKLKVFFFQAG